MRILSGFLIAGQVSLGGRRHGGGTCLRGSTFTSGGPRIMSPARSAGIFLEIGSWIRDLGK